MHRSMIATPPSPLHAQRRATLTRRVRMLVAFTITWNVVEAIVALAAGSMSSSIALLGFGLDSVVEVGSAAAVAWQFAGRDPARRERTAMRLIGLSFLGLATLVTIGAIRSLISSHTPEHSTVGIVLAALSLLVMPIASLIQRRTGQELGSGSAIADSKQTLICSYMSATLLLGLLLNSLFGWWWADPIAALVIAGIAVREGINAWQGKGCCNPAEALFTQENPPSCCDNPQPAATDDSRRTRTTA